ncbi:hypothetical protein WOLCODRAFT_88437 [Wolfiporia cocos MD-104 SS10]|uniref:Nucleoside diphosphate kinase n=1 Tax=Wolfiporia cocos (strain MD-104) TaxID=742152 RepID=A0A2H3JCT1_WOLCO|nr:hypothetical protein WOLCODRAFT_88437 [Wolfiporia cocos MD-104 SS10]
MSTVRPEDVALPATPPVLLSPPTSSLTRTVAIIKSHALNHRFDIEHRISEAGFEIAKERQMEFDTETDPETLYEIFGEDYVSFAEGPVWVYVLERRRAVEVWTTLMGDPDPIVAREQTPTAIRALYGISREQNAVMGSPDGPMAEMQIASIFPCSPPFRTGELPDTDGFPRGSLRSVSSSVLSALRKTTSSEGQSASVSTAGSKSGKPFKARPLPPTHVAPTITPRMSRTASLRAGLPVEKVTRSPPTKEQLAKTFENVPGHKRAGTITVASTAPPAIAPRMTRAASLRLGEKVPEAPKRNIVSAPDATRTGVAGRKSLDEKSSATFEGVPGHKRRETFSVASTKPPTVAPRMNKSAALRQQKDAAPPSSFTFRNSTSQTPSRPASRTSVGGSSSAPVPASRPASAASNQSTASRSTRSRIASTPNVTGGEPRRSPSVSRATTATALSTSSTSTAKSPETPTKPKPRPSSMQPTITPRTNKSALLRAAKMATATPTAPALKPKVAPAPRAVKV